MDVCSNILAYMTVARVYVHVYIIMNIWLNFMLNNILNQFFRCCRQAQNLISHLCSDLIDMFSEQSHSDSPHQRLYYPASIPHANVTVFNHCDLSIQASGGCPKCGKTAKGQPTCCGMGGSWQGQCGNTNNKKFSHTWTEGVQACSDLDQDADTPPGECARKLGVWLCELGCLYNRYITGAFAFLTSLSFLGSVYNFVSILLPVAYNSTCIVFKTNNPYVDTPISIPT